VNLVLLYFHLDFREKIFFQNVSYIKGEVFLELKVECPFPNYLEAGFNEILAT